VRIYNGQTGGEILPVCGYHDGRHVWCILLLDFVLFRLVAPPLQPGVVGPYLVWGAWFPNLLPLGGTCHVYIFWVVTSDPRYTGYKNLIVAPEPSVERVVGAVHLTGGKIGTHISLWVPS
jgi:hypothetical protein